MDQASNDCLVLFLRTQGQGMHPYTHSQADSGPLTWLMSCRWPVMRPRGLLLLPGSHRNMVKSSLPLASRSGLPAQASCHLARTAITDSMPAGHE